MRTLSPVGYRDRQVVIVMSKPGPAVVVVIAIAVAMDKLARRRPQTQGMVAMMDKNRPA